MTPTSGRPVTGLPDAGVVREEEVFAGDEAAAVIARAIVRWVPAGSSTAARIARVATSTAMVSSGRPRLPSSYSARTSRRVVPIWTCSPGRNTMVGVNLRPWGLVDHRTARSPKSGAPSCR